MSAPSEITPDGKVLPPLNITNPTPILSLRGFKWDSVDKPEDNAHHDDGGHHGKDQVPLVAAAASSLSGRPGPPGPGPRPGPPSPGPKPDIVAPRLPEVLADQLNIGAPPAPVAFPLSQFRGAWAGNGFNMIFRPLSNSTVVSEPAAGPRDNILELNLTTEQLTFGASLGAIPNRGFEAQPDITLGGLPYLQTIQDVTNLETGRGDKPVPTDIHFEPGIWLHVPAANFQSGPSVCRMASIPHGTTINAQGLIPVKVTTTALGGAAGGPTIPDVDTTPFRFGDPNGKVNAFSNMTAEIENGMRIPKKLDQFIKAGTITTPIIKNPNIVLRNHILGQVITETISFEVSTGPTGNPVNLNGAQLNGGGTANISFLNGPQAQITTQAPGATDNPNAHAELMRSRFWVETVQYQVVVPKMGGRQTVLLRPTMPAGATAPTPVFAITAPLGGNKETKTITVPGLQIQYSQTVNLNFGPKGFMLTWPHVSVATLVPTEPQPFQMK